MQKSRHRETVPYRDRTLGLCGLHVQKLNHEFIHQLLLLLLQITKAPHLDCMRMCFHLLHYLLKFVDCIDQVINIFTEFL